MSTLSFHATKPIIQLKGGALICHDEKNKEKN